MIVRVQLSDGRPNRSERYGRRTVTVDIPVTYSIAAPQGVTGGGNSSSSQ